MHLYLNGVRQGELDAYTGPLELVTALSAMDPVTDMPAVGAWKSLNVRRAGEELGTLFEVRQKCHRLQIERDAWANVMNVPYRPVRTGANKPKKAKKAKKGKKAEE